MRYQDYSPRAYRWAWLAAVLALCALAPVAGAVPLNESYSSFIGTYQERNTLGDLEYHGTTADGQASLFMHTVTSQLPYARIEGSIVNSYCCGFFGFASVAGISGHAGLVYEFTLAYTGSGPVPVGSVPLIYATDGEAYGSVPVVPSDPDTGRYIPAGAADVRADVRIDYGGTTTAYHAEANARNGIDDHVFGGSPRYHLDFVPGTVGTISMPRSVFTGAIVCATRCTLVFGSRASTS